MRGTPHARSGLKSNREAHVLGLGVQYRVPMSEKIYGFFDNLFDTWKVIAGTEELPSRHREKLRYRFGLNDTPRFFSPERALGITVAEFSVSHNCTKRSRTRWATDDAGRLKGNIEDTIYRLRLEAGLQLGPLTMNLSRAIPVGQCQGKGADRKFALAPAEDDPVAGYLVEAHHAIFKTLDSHVPIDLAKHYGDHYIRGWVPHLTVGWIHRTVERSQVNRCAEALNGLVSTQPLNVVLAQEEIYDRSRLQSY